MTYKYNTTGAHNVSIGNLQKHPEAPSGVMQYNLPTSSGTPVRL